MAICTLTASVFLAPQGEFDANSDIATMLLCTITLGFISYAAYLSWRIKKLDARIERREQALEAARRSGSASPAE